MILSEGTGLLLGASPFSVGRTLLLVLRWGIFLLACAFLWRQMVSPKGTSLQEALRLALAGGAHTVLLGSVLAAMPLNWWLESAKWRLLVAPLQRLSHLRAFVATVAGTSIALVTPNRPGEFVGRVLFLEPGPRIAGSFAPVLGGIAQLVVTLLFGGIALLVLLASDAPALLPASWMATALAVLTAAVAGIALLLYLVPGLLRQAILLLPFLNRFSRASAVLNSHPRDVLLRVLGLSMLRYGVFLGQFVLLLLGFPTGLEPGDTLLAVPVIFLVSTLLPTVLLTELGVRASLSVALLVPLGGDEAMVLLASTLLWAINLVLPAVAGSVVLLLARIRTDVPPPA